MAVSLGPLVAANVLLAAFYGVCMGVFGLLRPARARSSASLIANAVKVPLLFLLTLFVTFPSLYVFNALVRSPLGVRDLSRLLAASMGVLLAVLAAFGPIVAFFSVTTTSYPFIVLLNVPCSRSPRGSGWRSCCARIESLTLRPAPPRTVLRRTPVEESGCSASRPPRGSRKSRSRRSWSRTRRFEPVFQVWLVVFALVGVQMSWVLAAVHRIADAGVRVVPAARGVVLRSGDSISAGTLRRVTP